ncbi:MAG: hypothetical protein R3B67_11840 [Phycisphaerales bacterium]
MRTCLARLGTHGKKKRGSRAMCGFLAILETAESKGASAALSVRGSELIDVLAHRGPDQRGIWRGKGAWLGHRRLAIMAPEDGLQPIDDGRVGVGQQLRDLQRG